MKNVAPKPYFFSSGRTTVKWRPRVVEREHDQLVRNRLRHRCQRTERERKTDRHHAKRVIHTRLRKKKLSPIVAPSRFRTLANADTKILASKHPD